MEITVDFERMDGKGRLLADHPAGVEVMVGDTVTAVDKHGSWAPATVLEVGEQVLLDVVYEQYTEKKPLPGNS